jgi:CheY-like chemotaxis protein
MLSQNEVARVVHRKKSLSAKRCMRSSEEAFMLQTVIEKAPTIDLLSDSWTPRRQEMNTYLSKSILIVEDDPGIREIIEDILQEETIHQVFLAQDGKTALNMLQTTTPALFLLDYRLPDINGIELMNRIRRIKEYEQTPVVLMSASLCWENISGHHLTYLRKPFDLDRLLQVVEEALTVQDQQAVGYN